MKPFREKVGKAFGSSVVNPLIETVDVDEVVSRIDVDDVVRRIDIEKHVVERIDFNHLLSRIDLDALVDRIDVDRVLNRVDVSRLVLRSNVSSLVMDSTTGVVAHLIDAIRIQVIMVDLFFLRVTRGFWCCQRRGHGLLPQRPAGTYDDNHTAVPRGSQLDKAIAVQGRYAGFFAKACAIVVDMSLVTLTFGCLLIVVELCILILNQDKSDQSSVLHQASQKAANLKSDENQDSNALVFLTYGLYWFLYFFLGTLLTGQTAGMALVGLKVVNSEDGSSPVTARRAFSRSLLLPLTSQLLPVLGIVGAFRRDGRMLHDLVAGTGLVYKWNARLSKLRARALARLEHESFYSDRSTVGLDDERSNSNDDEVDSSWVDEESPLLLSNPRKRPERSTGGGGNVTVSFGNESTLP